MSEPKVVLWDFVGVLVDRDAHRFRIREQAVSRISQSKTRQGILSTLPAFFGAPQLRLFLRDNLLEAFLNPGLLINMSAFPVSPGDPRAFRAAAALAGEHPADILFVTANGVDACAAREAGFQVEGPAADAPAEGLLADTTPAAGLLAAVDVDTGPTFVLRGRIVTMDSGGHVIDNGRLAIRKGKIEAVLGSVGGLPSGFSSAPVIDTGATIYPGLIDLHNHFAYNIHELWKVPGSFENRTQWQRDKSYRRGVNQATGLLAKVAVYAKAMARFVEVKAVMGGTTSGQGIRMKVQGFAGLAKGVMRNIEITGDSRLQEAATLVPDLNANNASQVERFRRSLTNNHAFLYHLSEGTNSAARQRFLDLKDNNLVGSNLVGIHSLGLQPQDLAFLASKGGKAVWSPFSNLLLYGKTLDLNKVNATGMKVSLGSDWSPTGGKNLLEELKVARWVSKDQGGILSDERLVRMVTNIPAETLGWDSVLGSLRDGALADVLVIRGTSSDPYTQLINALERDIALVVIHGVPRYGDTALMNKLTAPASLEKATVDGKSKRLFLDTVASPVNGLSLSTAIKQLKEAMSDLKAVQQQVLNGGPGLLFDADSSFELELDMETPPPDETEASLFADGDEVEESMPLDTLFVDENHLTLVNSQPNLPNELKQELRHAYQ